MGLSQALSILNPELRPSLPKEWFSDPRFAHEGTEEVRTKGRTPPLPVQQALVFCRWPAP